MSDLTAGLASVGLCTGDTVLAHSSLRSFGYVEGGAATVIEALLETVGNSGTVVMPAFSWDNFHDKHGTTFDVRNTPSESGRITEEFRRREDALRSSHLCHSVAAIGRHAADITRETASAYGEGSAFSVLLQLNAWNLFLGVSLACCTALHLVEERLRVPYRAYRDFADCTVIHADGRRSPATAVEYLRQPGYRNDFGRMIDIIGEQGVLRRTTVGSATVTNVRLRQVVHIAQRSLSANPELLLATERSC